MFAKLAKSAKMDFTIQLKSEGNGLHRGVFSSGDFLEGDIIIGASEEVMVDSVDISFVGACSGFSVTFH